MHIYVRYGELYLAVVIQLQKSKKEKKGKMSEKEREKKRGRNIYRSLSVGTNKFAFVVCSFDRSEVGLSAGSDFS